MPKHETDICKPFTNYQPRHELVPGQFERTYRLAVSETFIAWSTFNVRTPYEYVSGLDEPIPYVPTLKQPREHPVPCPYHKGNGTLTWNWSGICDRHEHLIGGPNETR